MKNIWFGLIGLSIMVFLSCASAGGITTTSRETIDGKMTWETLVIIPKGMSFSTDENMGLSIVRAKKNDVLSGYYFEAEIHTGAWIFAEGISIKIDDKIHRLTDNSPNRKVVSGNYVIEQLNMEISSELIDEMKSATTFTAELHKRLETLKPDTLQKLKDFLQ